MNLRKTGDNRLASPQCHPCGVAPLLSVATARAPFRAITTDIGFIVDPRPSVLIYDRYRILISWRARYKIRQGEIEVEQTRGTARRVWCGHCRSVGRGAGQRKRLFHRRQRRPARSPGLGSPGCRERAASVGGSLNIDFAPGHGTKVALIGPPRSGDLSPRPNCRRPPFWP